MGSIKVAQVDPGLPHLMHEGHQRMWDRRQGQAGPGAATMPRCPTQGDAAVSGGTGSGFRPQADPNDSGDLIRLLVGTPGLSTEYVPSHASLMQQVGGGRESAETAPVHPSCITRAAGNGFLELS
jgi:hypothetical protein